MFDLKSGAILLLLLLLLLVPAGLVFYAQEWLVAGRSYVTVTGKGRGRLAARLGSTAAGLALLGFCVAIIALIGMPLGGLYGIVVGYLVGRTRFIGRKAMELLIQAI
jgi:iron(III) transport system permease protein